MTTTTVIQNRVCVDGNLRNVLLLSESWDRFVCTSLSGFQVRRRRRNLLVCGGWGNKLSVVVGFVVVRAGDAVNERPAFIFIIVVLLLAGWLRGWLVARRVPFQVDGY